MSAVIAPDGPVLAADASSGADGAQDLARTVDGLVARLDAQTAADGEAWSLYRAAGGGWVVAVGLGSSVHVDRRADDLSRSFTGPSLVGALVEACGSRRLPTVPAPPTLLEPDRFEIVKDDGWWYARDRVNRARVEFKYRTRREAEGALTRMVASQVAALAEWEARWGPVAASGVEGIDWRWAR